MTGRELCDSVRKLALSQYGLLAAAVLGHWGIRSTSDIGEIVYNMIATGDLEKTPSDSRSDFNNVFDFATALRPKLAIGLRRARLNAARRDTVAGSPSASSRLSWKGGPS